MNSRREDRRRVGLLPREPVACRVAPHMAGQPPALECLDLRGQELRVMLPNLKIGGDPTVFQGCLELHLSHPEER